MERTYLCLIPKVPNPEFMSDLRPISLCSVLYKAVSKILVKRLQPFLSNLISVNQSAFVGERLIQDNILIAHEAIHALRTHQAVSSKFMAVKTDMSKAYHRVEWDYLRSLLKAIGFDEKWISLVMMCVTSVSFAVLVNDQPYGRISPGRGLRQGDPLFPFLFVLCTEGLSHLLDERSGLLEGMSFAESGPAIHHLFFADDSLFLCQASPDQCKVLKMILNFYGEATGQCINFQKSSMTFGEQIPSNVRNEIKSIIGIENDGGTSKYLGLPECLSGSKVKLLSYRKDKTCCRLDSWFLRKLSQRGKEILLKTMASGLPVYAMSCFRVPKTIIKSISGAMANYWWSSQPHLRKIHWISWDKMCLPKALGGLGFKELESFNQALLAKQGWKLINQPESLLARFLKSSYYPHSEFSQAVIGVKPSFAWRSIIFGRELLMESLKWKVGDGKDTRVWLDKWIEDPATGMRTPWIKNYAFDVNLRASDLINTQTRKWDLQALQEVFVPGDIEMIMANQPVISRKDSYSWKHNRNGNMSVSSAYRLARDLKIKKNHGDSIALLSINPLREKIWKVTLCLR